MQAVHHATQRAGMPRGRANRECRTWLRKYASRSPKSLRTQAPAHRGNWRLLATPPRSPFAAPAPRRVRVLVALLGRKELRASDQRAFSPSLRLNDAFERCATKSPRRHNHWCPPVGFSPGSRLAILTEAHDELAPSRSPQQASRIGETCLQVPDRFNSLMA